MTRAALALMVTLAACRGQLTVEPLSEVERRAPPRSPVALHTGQPLPAHPEPKLATWTVVWEQRRDRAVAKVDRPAIMVDRDRQAQIEPEQAEYLSTQLTKQLERIQGIGQRRYDSRDAFIGAMWDGSTLRVLLRNTERDHHPHCSSRPSLLVVDLVPAGDGMLKIGPITQLTVDEGPLALDRGRLVFTSRVPLGERWRGTTVEPLPLPEESGLFVLEPDGTVRVLALDDTSQLAVDEHDRIWIVLGLPSRARLVGLRSDGRPFVEISLKEYGVPWGTAAEVTDEGPCLELWRRDQRSRACFDLEGTLLRWEATP